MKKLLLIPAFALFVALGFSQGITPFDEFHYSTQKEIYVITFGTLKEFKRVESYVYNVVRTDSSRKEEGTVVHFAKIVPEKKSGKTNIGHTTLVYDFSIRSIDESDTVVKIFSPDVYVIQGEDKVMIATVISKDVYELLGHGPEALSALLKRNAIHYLSKGK